MNIGVLADQGNVTNMLIGDAGDVLGPWSMKTRRADPERQ